MIWGDPECPSVGQSINDLSACRNACEQTAGCTAVNWAAYSNNCDLRACPRVGKTGLVPPPIHYRKGWSGYALQAIMNTPVIQRVIKGVDTIKSNVKKDVAVVENFGKSVGSQVEAAFHITTPPPAGINLAVTAAPVAAAPPPPPQPTSPPPPPQPTSPIPMSSVPVPSPTPASLPSPIESNPSPSPSPVVPSGSTVRPVIVPKRCQSPANSHSGCSHIGGMTNGYTLPSCMSYMNALGGDTINYGGGACYVKRCGSADIRYMSTGAMEVYSTFCSGSNQASSPRAQNSAPPNSASGLPFVSKFRKRDQHNQPEKELGVRHQPWFPSWFPNMLWLVIPGMVGMGLIYRKNFRSCKVEGSRDARFAFNANEDDVVATEPLRGNEDGDFEEVIEDMKGYPME